MLHQAGAGGRLHHTYLFLVVAGRCKALQPYNGNPAPDHERPLKFELGDVIELTNATQQYWFRVGLKDKQHFNIQHQGCNWTLYVFIVGTS